MNIKLNREIMSKDLEENDSRNTKGISVDIGDKNKIEIYGVASRSQNDLSLGHGVLYNQCFSGSDFQSQYEEECPVNYSLKYSETESCKAIKTGETSEKFEGFAEEYAETDLDQPTDFSLKYGESSGEDVKSTDFNYFTQEKQESPKCFGTVETVPQTISGEQSRESYSCEDETPLMFSRCSSLNSLSSFEHITQSIPDDRSSIVSDFSRTTSGIISPSELPDSPTQTAPSSPKRNNPVCFPLHGDLRQKKSVFEDDVATYKQEDTPIEFSRATSLSSLNIDNPVKAEFNLKTNSKASSIIGGDDVKAKDVPPYSALENDKPDVKDEIFSLKTDLDNPNVAIDTCIEEDDILIKGINNIRLNGNRDGHHLEKIDDDNEETHICPAIPERNAKLASKTRFTVKSSIPIFSNPPYEASDDDVHTYHTEGTPASISHAGSHSDLSTLSLISGIPPSGTANNSDNESFCSGSGEVLVSECTGIEMSEVEEKKTFQSLDEESVDAIFTKSCTPLEEALVEQCIRLGMPQKTNPKKLEVNNRKSLDHRAVAGWYSKSCTPLEEALVEQCIRLGMPRKNKKPETKTSAPLSEGKLKDTEHYFFQQKAVNQRYQFGHIKLPPIESRNVPYLPKRGAITPPPFVSYPVEIGRRTQSVQSLPTDSWFNESCTPHEEALVEQCIRLGMSQRQSLKNVENTTQKLPNTQEEPLSKAPQMSNSFTSGLKINQNSLSCKTQEKEATKKTERFVCNPARRQLARRKKSKETCRRCRKCREKVKGII